MKKSILIIVCRFNELVTRNLLLGAQELLANEGYGPERTTVLWVPGAFEAPATAAKAAKSGKYDAIIVIGCVIRGETPHFDFVAGQAASGLMQIGIAAGLPVIFGILTTDTVEQALNRAGLKGGNKGTEAARTAIEMIKTFESLN